MLSKPKLIFKVLIIIVSISVIGLIAKQVLATLSEWDIKKNTTNSGLEFNYNNAAIPQMTLTTGGVINAAGYTLNNGPMSGMSLICDIVFTATTASITLPDNSTNCPGTSLPQTYKDLEINISGVAYGATSGWVGVWARFNGDAGTNYGYSYLYGGSSYAPGAAGTTGNTYNWADFGAMAFGPTITSGQTAITAHLVNYSSNLTQKASNSVSAATANGTQSNLLIAGATWVSTAPITTITFSPGQGLYPFLSGSRITIYGLK